MNDKSIYICHKKLINKDMENTETTIEEILNSELINEMIEKENKELEEAGWTIQEVKEFAKAFIKK